MNRDFVSTKIVPTANIVTTILISKRLNQFRLVVFPSIECMDFRVKTTISSRE